MRVDPSDAAERFLELFHLAYLRFHARAARGERRISPESFGVLVHLASTGPLTISECCLHFERSQAAMSDIVTRLERRGLVARVADERDRRRTLVWLTPRGRTALERATRVLDTARLAEAFEHLSGAERRRLLALFAAVVESSRTAGEGERP